MANIPNNPWIEKKKELLKDTAVFRTTQSYNEETDDFSGVAEYLDRRPEQYLKAILTNQHKYVARREREGTLIEGLDYENMAKHVAEGTVVKELLGTQPMKTNDGKVYYFQYRYEDNPELEGTGGRSMSLNVVASDVSTLTQKCKTGISVSCIKNLERNHKDWNAAKELEEIVASALVQELDDRYIQKLIDISAKYPNFDFSTIFQKKDPEQPAFIADRFSSVIINISKTANDIARKTHRGPGNWILCSPMMVSVLQVSQHAVFAPALKGSFKGPNCTMLVGKLNGSIDVYSYLPTYYDNTHTPIDKILIGYKGGSGELDGGLFYCPHTMVTHGRKYKKDGEIILPFATKEASFAAPNASDYYATFDVINLSFA